MAETTTAISAEGRVNMTIFKFKKRIEIEKSIGNIKLETFHYGSYEGGKHKDWTELHLWYDNDCEHCPCGWEYRSYEGECDDCGCLFDRKGGFDVPTWKCMLPKWIKRLFVKHKEKECPF